MNLLFQPNNLSGRGFGASAGGKKGMEEIADCGLRISDCGFAALREPQCKIGDL
jgi:hypothetical protein